MYFMKEIETTKRNQIKFLKLKNSINEMTNELESLGK